MINDLLVILIASTLINNIVLSYFLGLCPIMGTSEKVSTALRMGFAVILVITLASAVNGVIYELLLLPYNITFMQTFIYILVIIALVLLIEVIMNKLFKKSFQAIGIYFPVIITNCVVLGAVLLNSRADYGFIYSTFNGFSLAAGFMVVIVVLAGIREKIIYNNIPESFKGLPLILLIVGLMSMAFFGFSFLN